MTAGRVGLRLLSLADGSQPDGFGWGEWLQSVDLDAHAPGAPYPTGLIDTTPDPAQAMAFQDAGEAMALWKQPSRTVPLRPDGKPNRPLTAITVTVEQLGTGGTP